jgi:hypothetical protein
MKDSKGVFKLVGVRVFKESKPLSSRLQALFLKKDKWIIRSPQKGLEN